MEKPINCFPGYEMVITKDARGVEVVHNMYRGTDLGLGGYVYYEPGIYENVALIDAASLHPTSIINLNKLGKYTKRYEDLRTARVLIKHHDYEGASKLFDGKLAKYLTSEEEADALSKALKLPLNSFFGISFSSYETPARDPRDINNIIALRGALFMRTLQDEVEQRGFHIVHIKTDSCKIPNATPEIISFVQEFGKKYGYEMEHECTYKKMCLVNGSTYIAKYDEYGIRNKGGKKANKWDAVAAQFQVPYVFKTLFSHEPIKFSDLCEAKQASKGQLYLDFNEDLEDVSDLEDSVMKIQKSDRKLSTLNDELSGNSKVRSEELIQKDISKEQRVIEKQLLYLQSRLDVSGGKDELMSRAQEAIAQGHNYQFIGGVGLFTPIIPGGGGALLLRRDDNGKYSSATGTKGYRWMESEFVGISNKENLIDKSYYTSLVDEAVKDITYWCDETNKKEGTNYNFEWFAS